VAIVGGQGEGKTVVVEYLRKIIGAPLVTVSQEDHVVGKFNAQRERCQVLHFEEAFFSGDKKIPGVLKDLVTGEHMQIERKGVDAFQVENNLRLIITSNDRVALRTDIDDRRWLILETDPKQKNNETYFSPLFEEMGEGGPAALLHFLLNRKVDGARIRRPISTEAKTLSKLASLPVSQQWWHFCLTDGYFSDANGFEGTEWPRRIARAEFRKSLRAYEKNQNVRHPVPENQIKRELDAVLPPAGLKDDRPEMNGRRVYSYRLPDLQECRLAFEEAVGATGLFDQD